jgi:hypothetical protein
MAMINTKFSISFRRHVLAHEFARGAVLTMALAQAWDRFLYVFIRTFQVIGNFSFEKDPANDKGQEQEDGTYCNPQTDFRVLGVQVFTDHIGKKYANAPFPQFYFVTFKQVPADHVRLSLFYIRYPIGLTLPLLFAGVVQCVASSMAWSAAKICPSVLHACYD